MNLKMWEYDNPMRALTVMGRYMDALELASNLFYENGDHKTSKKCDDMAKVMQKKMLMILKEGLEND